MVIILISIRELQRAGQPIAMHDVLDLPDFVQQNQQVLGMSPVDVDVEATFRDGLTQVDGQIGATVQYQCSRCLEPFESPLRAHLKEVFSEGPSEDEEVITVHGDTLEMNPYIEEELQLALDYRPLCSVDCKGLCPQCGVNRNISQCGCDTRKIDPRLAALEGLLLKDETE